jgi:hypothetical protein
MEALGKKINKKKESKSLGLVRLLKGLEKKGAL